MARPLDGTTVQAGFYVLVLREVDGDEAPPLKKFSSKLKGKSFSLFKLGDPKLPYLISGLTSFQSPDIY